MPILNKLEYLDETKQQIKNALNTKFNSQITDENTFRSYVDKIKNIYTNWPKITGEGTNITLNNTKKGRLTTELNGDLSQETTTGKNFFDIGTSKDDYFKTFDNGTRIAVKNMSFVDITINGSKLTVNSYDNAGYPWLSKWLNLKKNTEYTLSGTITMPMKICGFSSSAEGSIGVQIAYMDDVNQLSPKIFNSGDYEYYCISIYPRLADKYFENLQVEEGSTQTEYEPYTNGASPNPDYPQEIKVATGNQNVKIHGKNFFDKNNPSYLKGYFTTNESTITSANNDRTIYIPCKPNTTYTISKISSPNARAIGYTSTIPTIGSIVEGSQNINANLTTGTITTGSNAKYLVIRIWNVGQDSGLTFQQMLNTVQIELGPTATPYEPYQSQTYPLPLGSLELAKIGNYKDYIYRENGKWYKYEKIGKKIFNGSEDWRYNSSYTHHVFWTGLLNYARLINVRTVYSDFYLGIPNTTGISEFGTNYNNSIGVRSASDIYNNIYISNDNISTVEDFKTWLSTHNITVYYVLEAPVITEITDTNLIEQLDNLYNANSYDDTTIIFSDGDLPIVMNASALMKGGA